MQKTDWVEVKERLKKAVQQGVKVLKQGSEEARYAAGQTAHVLQLEMDIYGLKNQISKATASLGDAVHRSVKDGKIKMTPEIKELIADLDTLKSFLKKRQGEVQSTNLTRKKSR